MLFVLCCRETKKLNFLFEYSTYFVQVPLFLVKNIKIASPEYLRPPPFQKG